MNRTNVRGADRRPKSVFRPPPRALPWALPVLLLLPTNLAGAQLTPPALLPPASAPALEYEGAVEIGLALRRLGNTARVLHIAAHPDDENTALFAPLVLGRGADAAYLSLTRGEGGQNGIGPELGTALGLIRSEELLAARAIDGAGQFFTRAVDFGFSKTAGETFRHWPRDSVLADVVAVIRRYRPDVVVSVWSGTRRDGHGQHEASGLLAREAVLAAGDPARYEEQVEAGLRPHETARYFWSARYGADGPDVELNTGVLDPLLGRSWHQIAMASRSRHRSQDMGVPEAPGPRRTAFDAVDPADPPEVATSSGGRPRRQLEGSAAHERSLFAGVDTLLSQRAAGVAPAAVEPFRRYEAAVARARETFDALAPWEIVPLLLDSRAPLEAGRDAVARAAGRSGRARRLRDLRFHAALEESDLRDAALAAANLRLDVRSGEELVVPGQTFELELSVWNGGDRAVTAWTAPALPEGWTARRAEEGEDAMTVAPGQRSSATWRVRVAQTAGATTPYFLDFDQTSTDQALYDWPADYRIRGLPFGPGPVRGRFTVELGPPAAGEAALPDSLRRWTVEREAAWVGLDARSGEFRRPVRVVPAVSVSASPRLMVMPLGGGSPDTVSFGIRLRSELPGGTSGTLRPAVPEGWTVAPDSVQVEFAGEGDERTVRFTATPPAGVESGVYRLGALFETPGCGGVVPCAALSAFVHGYELVDYPHIDPHHLYRPAVVTVRALPVRVADVRVGYVAGVPDGVPEALDQLGVPYERLDPDALAGGDLGRFDVIVTGTRAYEVRSDLVTHNDRLLDWTRRGGTLVVQYNKYPALEGSYAPWPVTIARPHGRVTDETAPVTVLEPDHPVFNTPNRLDAETWEGWVQERGLYFWETWGGPLRPLLAMSDPGEPPLEGALLVARLGRGTYVYSALALFRQLPEGVPGAWRLLANLVSLGADARAAAP